MGCVSRIVIILALLIQIAAAAFGMVVVGSAGLLGNAAFINSTDAMAMFILLALSLIAAFVLALKLWVSSRSRKRLRKAGAPLAPSSTSPWGNLEHLCKL